MRIQFKTSYESDIRLFRDRYQAGWYALLGVIMVALPWLIDVFLLGEINNVLIFAIAGMGLMILVGQTGQASLGHAAFLAAGCYANVILQERAGLPFVIAFPLAGIISGIIGALIALPMVRLHGIYLAIATLAISIITEDIIIIAEPLTGGVGGLFAPDISLFGYVINRYGDPAAFYWFTLAVTVFCIWLYRNLLRSPLGRAFAAVRNSEVSAQAMGINVPKTKAIAFGLSTFVTGLAGAILGHYIGVFTPEAFNVLVSIQLLLMIVVGGLGTIHGAFFGALVVALMPTGIAILRDWVAANTGLTTTAIPGLETAVFGVILIVFMLFEPMGIFGIWVKIRTYFELFPFYRQGMFTRQKSYLKTERMR